MKAVGGNSAASAFLHRGHEHTLHARVNFVPPLSSCSKTTAANSLLLARSAKAQGSASGAAKAARRDGSPPELRLGRTAPTLGAGGCSTSGPAARAAANVQTS